jgi:CHAT domain-containing protein/tetratricopeptide (TPR) repeat protein
LPLCAAAHTEAQSLAPAATLVVTDCKSLSDDSAPLPDSPESSKRLVDCGHELSGQSDHRRAQRLFEQAMTMAKRRLDRRALAAALNGYGGVLTIVGQANRAEPMLLESLHISEEMTDSDGIAEASSSLGRLRNMQGRYDEARAYHTRSFEAWTANGDERGAVVALNNIGSMYRAIGDYQTALEYFQRSLDGLEKLGDTRRSATVLDNMGLVSRRLGDYTRGFELAEKALKIRESFADRVGIAKSLDSLSEVYEAQGNYAAALTALGKSLDLRRAIGAAHATAEAFNNIAVAYQAQGGYQQAVKYLRQSLAQNDAKVGSKSLTAEIHTHLGELYFLQGQHARALQALKRSLSISQASDYKIQAADARYVLGRLYTKLGQFDAADRTFKQCLEFRDAAGDRHGRADVLIEMADLERQRGRDREGLSLATEARRLADTMELPDVQWRALTLIGRLQVRLSAPAEAGQAFDEAIVLIESMRAVNVGGEDTRSRFFADRLAPYQERISLALAASDPADALYVAERSKARALLDVIRGDTVPITSAMTEEERQRERELRTSLSSANTEIGLAARAIPRDETRLSDLKQKRESRRLAYEDFQARLYAAHPELQANRVAVPAIRVPEAQHLLSGPAAAIVEFVAGPDKTIAFVITTTGLSVFTLHTSTRELAWQVQRFREQLANRDLRASISARTLYRLVLGPLHAVLHGKTELVVVPDGMLWELPFQALQSGADRYVIEDTAISYAPSITVLREMMRRRIDGEIPRTLFAIGNPTNSPGAALPETEREVNRLAQIYGQSSRVYIGADAREDRLKREAADYRVVHLATHGVLDNVSPLYSHLALAQQERGQEDGVLEAWEVMNLRLSAELVVLSACETARGRLAPGEGVIGLMWALFVAGSPATLVSQWQVDSASSTVLMSAFHEEWNTHGRRVSKTRALQLASLKVLRSPGFSHPFYWAGFILAGDGR